MLLDKMSLSLATESYQYISVTRSLSSGRNCLDEFHFLYLKVFVDFVEHEIPHAVCTLKNVRIDRKIG